VARDGGSGLSAVEGRSAICHCALQRSNLTDAVEKVDGIVLTRNNRIIKANFLNRT